MFCPKCGKPVDDDSKFCLHCGSPIDSVKPEKKESTKSEKKVVKEQPKQENNKQDANSNISINNNPPQNKKINLFFIIGGALALVIIVFLLYTNFFSGNPIDLLNGMNFTVEGYNDYGCLTNDSESGIEPNLESELNVLEEKALTCAIDEQHSVECAQIIDRYNNLEAALFSIEYVYDVTDNKSIYELSNGDTVNISVSYDKNAFKKLGYKPKNSKRTIVVSGLPEPERIDISEYLSLKWTELDDSYVLTTSVSSDCPVDDIPCTISSPDTSGNAAVTINVNEFIDAYGLVPTKTYFTFNVGYQPVSIGDLSDENREDLYELATFVLNDVYANKCGSNLYISGKKEVLNYATTDDITSLSVKKGTVKASFRLATEDGHSFTKNISFEAYIDQNGDYVSTAEIDDSLGCSIINGDWPEYEPSY